MTDVWIGIAGILVVAVGMRIAGPVLGPRELPAPALRVVALLAPALLAGLVVSDVAGRSWDALDLPLVGGLAACAAVRLLAGGVVGPVVGAVATTALLRLL